MIASSFSYLEISHKTDRSKFTIKSTIGGECCKTFFGVNLENLDFSYYPAKTRMDIFNSKTQL